MSETMQSQPEQLRRMLADTTGVDAAAQRLRGRRLFLAGTGTSWHAANIGAWFLRAAGVEAWPVQAMDAVLYGPRPAGDDGLFLNGPASTKTYTMQLLERARAQGVPTAVISGQGAPGAEIETSVVERSAAYTAATRAHAAAGAAGDGAGR
jgi:glucosamine--fructose-6-phosphate aminotransferase (isomerizing)